MIVYVYTFLVSNYQFIDIILSFFYNYLFIDITVVHKWSNYYIIVSNYFIDI